jgi:hypothetical protein
MFIGILQFDEAVQEHEQLVKKHFMKQGSKGTG